MNKVYYLGFYGDEKAYGQNRHLIPSGVNKMHYVASAMGNVGFDVTVVSPAWVDYDKSVGAKFYKQRKFLISKNVDGVLPFSIAMPFRISRPFTRFLSKVWLIIFFLFKIRKDDKVVVYHSPFYFNTVYWLKKIIGFNLILEVEELYSIVFSMGSKRYGKEKRLIDASDSYIFPNDLMYSFLKIKEKKQIVVYGSYSTNKSNSKNIDFEDDKIHLVYAGVIDKLKKGAFNAIRSAKDLTDNYTLHILGVGNDADVNALKREIHEINSQSDCKVIFEGMKTGEEYINFLSGCQIGLSTQINDGEYLKFTFPSKVLSYLSSGLHVVSAKMDCLSKSSIDSLIHYYENDGGEAIANAILSIKDFNKQSLFKRISELDKEFEIKIKNLLK